ncbi:MAG: phosphate ABC transporter permease PstA [Bacteroidales bacterium]|nr:phosphate ABC transporter permease PstA [Bacteroidales bacterium]
MRTKLKHTNTKGRIKKDKFALITIISFTVITILPLVLIIGKLVVKGIGQINIDFFTRTTPNTLEAMVALANDERIPGGILNGITGSLYMLLIASAIAIPVGILTGVFLSENPNKRYSNIVRDVADVLQGVPSIVMGIIAYMWIVKHITHGFSALAGSVALAIMMLPLIIRSTEETMKMIPASIREAGFALGIPYHKIIFRILLPSGMSGLLTGILLAISRILGETAPLMMTALGSSVVNFNAGKPTSSVPLLIWEFYNDPNMISLIWGSSLFLMFIILGLNITAKRIAKKWKIQ